MLRKRLESSTPVQRVFQTGIKIFRPWLLFKFEKTGGSKPSVSSSWMNSYMQHSTVVRRSSHLNPESAIIILTWFPALA